MKWRMDCKYAPVLDTAKHCRKQNEGEGRLIPGQDKEHYHRANKGYFGCSRKCRYFERVEK